MTGAFFDTHAHIDGPEFDEDRDAVIGRAREAGLTHMVLIGASDGFDSNPRAVALAEQHDDMFATVGLHPHDAKLVNDDTLAKLEAMASKDKVVAIGETGLDYYYDQSPRDVQRDAFRKFLRMSHATKKPCVVHTRDAEDDTIEILRSEDAAGCGGVIHCFTGTQKLADAAIDLGWYISFSGVLTFRNADPLRAIAKDLPKDRVLVETDCPYLTPVPHRGKRNEPSFVVHTAACLADLWDVDAEAVRRITGENALRFFALS